MAQTKLDSSADFKLGQISACKIFEEYFLEQEKRGREFWKSGQVYSVIRSVRLNLEEIFND